MIFHIQVVSSVDLFWILNCFARSCKIYATTYFRLKWWNGVGYRLQCWRARKMWGEIFYWLSELTDIQFWMKIKSEGWVWMPVDGVVEMETNLREDWKKGGRPPLGPFYLIESAYYTMKTYWHADANVIVRDFNVKLKWTRLYHELRH